MWGDSELQTPATETMPQCTVQGNDSIFHHMESLKSKFTYSTGSWRATYGPEYFDLLRLPHLAGC
jgi:hypothetical protein